MSVAFFIRLRAENPVSRYGDERVNAKLRRDVAGQA